MVLNGQIRDTDLLFQLMRFESVTPDGALLVWQDFLSDATDYFERGEEFNQLLNDALFGQMFDEFMVMLNIEYAFMLPTIIRKRPEYYRDVEKLFKGADGSEYPFYEAMTLNASTFRAGWIFEGGGGAAGPSAGAGIWRNHYLEEWKELILEAKRRDESRLNEIKDYALKAYEIWSHPLLNEELGRRNSIYFNRCYDLLLETFMSRKWQWAYKVFEMSVHEPAIIEEWRRNEEA